MRRDAPNRPARGTFARQEIVNVQQGDQFKIRVSFTKPFKKIKRLRTVSEHRIGSQSAGRTHRLDIFRYERLEKVRGWGFQLAVKAQPFPGNLNERNRRSFRLFLLPMRLLVSCPQLACNIDLLLSHGP